MAQPDDLASFYDTEHGDAELVTVAGTTVAAIFDTASEVVLGDAVVRAPTLRLPATVAAAVDNVCTVRGQSHRVRQVLLLPPDGVEQLLVLAQG